MITAKDLKNGKVIPAWMVHKAAGVRQRASLAPSRHSKRTLHIAC
jgi:hypothetical protein